jgi:hypothetical protein
MKMQLGLKLSASIHLTWTSEGGELLASQTDLITPINIHCIGGWLVSREGRDTAAKSFTSSGNRTIFSWPPNL